MASKIDKEYMSRLKEQSKWVADGPPAVYQVPLNKKYSSDSDNTRKFEFGKEFRKGLHEKVLMLVGATGSGKTTLINGLFNFLLGVKWKDSFRFRLVDETEQVKGKTQAGSQTSWITSYTIHHCPGLAVDYRFTIIDTPGFGDTQGIKRDKQITDQIRKFFSQIGDVGIDHIDAVGFVVQAALPRLTATQTYIFDSVLSLFGKDIADNIFMFVTFADGQKPEALAALESAKIPYKVYLKFNNSALFADNNEKGTNNDDDDSDENENFDEMFWKMTSKSYKKFLLSHLDSVEPKSLVLTKTVLEKRHQLEIYVKGIQQDIQVGLIKCEQISKELQVIQQHQKDIESNKEFTYQETIETWEKVPIVGEKAVNCTVCERTCDYPCGAIIAAKCSAMKWFMSCINCNHSILKHRKSNYRYELTPKVTVKKKEDMLKRYMDAKGKQLSAIEMSKKAQEELKTIREKVIGLTESARKALEEITRIALKPNPLSVTDYIDLMIETEKREAKEGWKERLVQLEDIKKETETIKKVTDPAFQQQVDEGLTVAEEKGLNSEEKKERGILKTIFNLKQKFIS